MALGEAAVGVRQPEGEQVGALLDRPRAPRADELAWLALLPCAALLLLLIVVFGPPLGRMAFPSSGLTFWPSVAEEGALSPEPTEQGRFLVALLGPLLLSGAVVLGLRRRVPLLRPSTFARLVVATQATALGFIATCMVVQYRHTFRLATWTTSEHTVYFRPPTLVAAGAIALVLSVGLASARARRCFAVLARERAGRRTGAIALAVAAVAIWLLPAINFERTIVNANDVIVNHLPFWLDEVSAVLDGRYPLVSFAAQYGSLWPYPIAGAMALLGASVGVFTVTNAALSATAMLAVLATFRRVVGSTVVAVLVFLPFLATSFYMMEGPLDNRYAIDNLFGTFPLRYAGPLLLLWLVGRALAGARPRRSAWLFVAAGLVVLNNSEFGVPALGATIAALLWTGERPNRASVGRLAAEAAAGLLAAGALVSLLTLVVAGALPDLSLLFRYSRIFALGGWGLLPMTPTIGTSTIVYLTYVAAIAVATVRAVRREPDRLLTGLLAWSGVFGLGIGAYYMGRSHPEVLTNMFCAWALSLTLLLVAAVRSLLERGARRPSLPEAACLFAFGVLACSLAQFPTPWSQVAKLQHVGLAIYGHPSGEEFVAAHVHRGEAVAILKKLGHRVAYNLGVTDVTPYTGALSMPTLDQLDETLSDLRAAGGHSVFLSLEEEGPEVVEALRAAGYALVARERYGMAEFSRRG